MPEDGGVISAEDRDAQFDAAGEPVDAAIAVDAAALMVPQNPLDRAGAESAAEGKAEGSLSGTISSADEGIPLEGAHIYVRGEPYQAVADSSGAFTLAVPTGTYQLSVIYPGYATQTISNVQVRPAKPTTLNLELRLGSLELDEMVVTGAKYQGGIATLVAERRETKSVAELIGSEQMSKAGDSSAASALKRVTGLTIVGGKFIYIRGMGDRYSGTLLNGLRLPSPEPDVRVVPLDLIPAGLLEGILVQKGYSPEFPGDFGGGVVSMRTKRYPDDFTLSISGGLGGNTSTTFRNVRSYESGKLDWLGIDDGGRELPAAVADARERPIRQTQGPRNPDGFSREEVQQLGREFDESRWRLGSRRVMPDGDISLVVGNTYRLPRGVRWGFVGAGLYSHEWHYINDAKRGLFNLQGMRQRTSTGDTLEREVLLGGMLDTGIAYARDQKLQLTTILLRQATDETFYSRQGFSGEAGGDVQQSRFAFVERQLFSQQVRGEQLARRANNLKVEWKYAFSIATRDEPNHLEYLYFRPENSSGPFSLYQRSGSNLRMFSQLDDRLHDARLDISQPAPVWKGLEAKLKLGAAIFKQEREVDTRRFTLDAKDTAPENLTLPPAQSLGSDLIGVQGGTSFSEPTLPTDPYQGTMQNAGGYGAVELPITKRIDLMGGLRVEKFDMKVSTVESNAKIDTLDLLPATSVTYRVSDEWQLRGSFAQTTNRPDMRELSPSQFTDVQTGITKRGNPDLRAASLRHYDARVEWYLSPDESVSLGGFYKSFENPIEVQLLGGGTPTQSWANADGGYNTGLELEARKRLGFLHKLLSEAYVSGNLALIKSEVELAPGGVATNQKRPLAGQSPWVINMQLGYDAESSGLSTNLLYNVAGPRIDSVGVNGLDDVMERPFHQLDFVVTKELRHGFRLGFKARNMLNSERVLKQGDFTFLRYRRGADLSLNLTWSM